MAPYCQQQNNETQIPSPGICLTSLLMPCPDQVLPGLTASWQALCVHTQVNASTAPILVSTCMHAHVKALLRTREFTDLPVHPHSAPGMPF